MNAAQLLANSLSEDAHTRQTATQQLEAAAAENFPAYISVLSAELINEQTPQHVRTAAGLALKNALTAKDASRQVDAAARWQGLHHNVATKVKNEALSALSSSNSRVGAVGAQVVAAIAAIELPNEGWPELISGLLTFVNNGENTSLRVATLQAIGYICESVPPEILKLRANEILTAVVQGARRDEPSSEVQLAALKALYNSLEFIKDNFEREGERNYIMQVVCEATQNANVSVQAAAFEVLVKIMSNYYDKMSYYMERALFGLTVLGMNHPDERVALQAVEFWSTVCEEEIELAIEAAEALDYNEVPDRESKYFAKVALPEIIPVILRLLTRQEEDADEDEWNISMAAGTCLTLLAQAVGDAIVPHVIPFIESNIKSTDWHQREAAVMTFGSILDGPDPQQLSGLVSQALPLLIEMMRDTNPHVKDTTAWTLGRICDILITTIKPDLHLQPLVVSLVSGLQENPRIICNACWALMTLSDQINEGDDAPTGPLSPYYQGVVGGLMSVTDRPTNEANFRTAAYEALASYIQHAPADALQVVRDVIVTILSRMESLLGMVNQLVGVDDKNNWTELQGNFCSIIGTTTRKLGAEIQPLAERIMTDILQLVQVAGKQSTVLEDAFLVIGSMASALEGNFHPFLSAFLPFLGPALTSHEDPQLCSVAVGLIGDICRALGDSSAQYCDMFMNSLLTNLQNPLIDRQVKIPIVSCFGDIAMAIGSNFEPYLETTMAVLHSAGEQRATQQVDYESVEYLSALRESIIDAFVGIITGLKGTPKRDLLLKHVPNILHLLQLIYEEEATEISLKASAGLIGDLADTFHSGQIKPYLLKEWISTMLRTKTRNQELKKTLRWARELVKRATA